MLNPNVKTLMIEEDIYHRLAILKITLSHEQKRNFTYTNVLEYLLSATEGTPSSVIIPKDSKNNDNADV